MRDFLISVDGKQGGSKVKARTPFHALQSITPDCWQILPLKAEHPQKGENDTIVNVWSTTVHNYKTFQSLRVWIYE